MSAATVSISSNKSRITPLVHSEVRGSGGKKDVQAVDEEFEIGVVYDKRGHRISKEGRARM